MRERLIGAAAVGALAAALTRLICPNPPWWAVGALVALVLLCPPTPPSK